MPSLGEYRRKRDPARTSEPFGGASGGGAPVFVVQRHAARRLHYDLRLERAGVLASWALPKGLPLEAGAKHLAVQVEDHPLDYADFEGEIPAGEYGAGTVEIWDRGTYELVEEKRDGGLTVRLAGARVAGSWTLVPASLGGDPRNWLILRKSGSSAARSDYRPMLASATAEPPRGEGWLHEVKFDGFRAIVTIRGGEARLASRNGNDLTARFAEISQAAGRAVKSPDCVLDGEICALDEAGRPSFDAMQRGSGPFALYLFDALEIEGEPLLELPLAQRRERQRAILDADSPAVVLSEAFGDGAALLEAASAQGLEGIVSKRAESRYLPGRRSRDWLKVKNHSRQELVIAGYTKGQGRRVGTLGALVLAVHQTGGLRWAGNVGTGFGDAEIERLLGLLRPLERSDSPFAEPPRMPRVRAGDVVWVEPVLVAEVEFAEWTREGRLRAPSYKGLREDKPAGDVRRERTPLPGELRRGSRLPKLSNLDKPFWPEERITKGDLLSYYRDVAPALLPHLRNRPFTMKRYPDGWQGKHFFQKDAPAHMPEWIPRVPLPSVSRAMREPRTISYPLVNDELTLIWMASMGCIDLNVPAARVDRLDRPDWVLFDLDPSEGSGFAECVRVALLVKEALDLLGLASYPKTSGSRGIHVLCPVARRHTWEQVRELATVVAGAIAAAHPGLATAEPA